VLTFKHFFIFYKYLIAIIFLLRWSLIAEKLPGRTDHEIKNYWHSYLKKCSKSNDYKDTISELIFKPCEIVEGNDTQHFVTPEIPISDVGKDFHYILESSTITISRETSVEDNSSPASINCPIMEEDNVAPWLVFESFTGDFWTDPCTLEETSTTNEISSEDIDLLIQDFYDGSYMF